MKIEDCIYQYNDLIGSIVRLKNLPANNIGEVLSCKRVRYTIKDILFRVDSYVAATTLLEFKEIPGKYFSLYGSLIDTIFEFKNLDSICGQILAGDSLCGHNTTSVPDQSGSGIKFIDDEENVIDSGYVYINKSRISTFEGDNNETINIITVDPDGGGF